MIEKTIASLLKIISSIPLTHEMQPNSHRSRKEYMVSPNDASNHYIKMPPAEQHVHMLTRAY